MSQQSITITKQSTYKPLIEGRNVIIQRTSGGRASMPGMSFHSRTSMGPAYAAGTYQQLSSSGVANVRDSRQKEKKEMQGLNERLASYIEQCRFLESTCKMLEDQLKQLRQREDFDLTPIRQMYEGELEQARKVIDDLSKEKAGVDAKIAGLQDELERQASMIEILEKHKIDNLSKINQLSTQIGEYEGELGSLRLRNRNAEDENDKLRELLNKANEDLKRLRSDLDNETAAHIEAASYAQTCEERAAFYKSVLDNLPKQQAPITQIQGMDMKKWWGNEMAKALRDIQQEYEGVVQNMRDDMQMRMDVQVRQLQSGALKDNLESTHLKEEVSKLKSSLGERNSALQDALNKIRELESEVNRLGMEYSTACRDLDEFKVKYTADMDRLNSELEGCLAELQCIMDAKLSLELEICCYRQLLEGEENRGGLKQIVEQAMGTQSSSASKLSEYISGGSSSMSSEASGRMTQSRSSRGNISFVSGSVDGSYIEIENNTSGMKAKVQNLKGWQMKKSVPGKPDINFLFGDCELKAGQKFRIYARGATPGPGDKVGCDYTVNNDCFSWGSAGTIQLFDESNNEKASLKSTITNLK